MGDHRWWISDLREFQADYPDWEPRVRPERDPARDPRPERRALERRVVKLSVVIPARNEEGSIGDTVGPRPELERAGIDHEIIVVDDGSTDGTARRRGRDRGGPTPGALHPLALQRRLRPHRAGRPRELPGRRRGDRDGRRLGRPAGTWCATTTCWRRATTARSARASSPARRCTDYPKLKLAMNRVVNFGIRMLFRHGYNDTTNAFKAYRREVIDNIQPLLSNHFNLTVELPLKAFIRGHSYAIVPISWRNRDARRVEARPARDGQPLPLHRALRLPRAPPEPRRLPPSRLRSARRPWARPRCCGSSRGERQTPTAGPRE